MTRVIEIYYYMKSELNNIDNYKSYKFFIRRDKNIEVIIILSDNNYKINNLFVRDVENIIIIQLLESIINIKIVVLL